MACLASQTTFLQRRKTLCLKDLHSFLSAKEESLVEKIIHAEGHGVKTFTFSDAPFSRED